MALSDILLGTEKERRALHELDLLAAAGRTFEPEEKGVFRDAAVLWSQLRSRQLMFALLLFTNGGRADSAPNPNSDLPSVSQEQ